MSKVISSTLIFLLLVTLAGCATKRINPEIPIQSELPQTAIADPQLKQTIAKALTQTHSKVRKAKVTVLQTRPIDEVG